MTYMTSFENKNILRESTFKASLRHNFFYGQWGSSDYNVNAST